MKNLCYCFIRYIQSRSICPEGDFLMLTECGGDPFWRQPENHETLWGMLREWNCVDGIIWEPVMVLPAQNQKTSWPRFSTYWPSSDCWSRQIMYFLPETVIQKCIERKCIIYFFMRIHLQKINLQCMKMERSKFIPEMHDESEV